MENLFPLTALSNYVSKIKQRCLSMCGPRVCVCLINIFSFGWRFSSGLNLEHSQQQSQSLSAGMLLLEQGSQTSSREIRSGWVRYRRKRLSRSSVTGVCWKNSSLMGKGWEQELGECVSVSL